MRSPFERLERLLAEEKSLIRFLDKSSTQNMEVSSRKNPDGCSVGGRETVNLSLDGIEKVREALWQQMKEVQEEIRACIVSIADAEFRSSTTE